MNCYYKELFPINKPFGENVEICHDFRLFFSFLGKLKTLLNCKYLMSSMMKHIYVNCVIVLLVIRKTSTTYMLYTCGLYLLNYENDTQE